MTEAVQSKPVPDFPGYRITEFGVLTRDGRAVPFSRNRQGFAVYWPRRKGKDFKRRAIDLVAAAFLGFTDARRKADNLAVWPKDGNEANVLPDNIIVLRNTADVMSAHLTATPSRQLDPDEPPLIDFTHCRTMRREFLRSAKNLEIISK